MNVPISFLITCIYLFQMLKILNIYIYLEYIYMCLYNIYFIYIHNYVSQD